MTKLAHIHFIIKKILKKACMAIQKQSGKL